MLLLYVTLSDFINKFNQSLEFDENKDFKSAEYTALLYRKQFNHAIFVSFRATDRFL